MTPIISVSRLKFLSVLKHLIKKNGYLKKSKKTPTPFYMILLIICLPALLPFFYAPQPKFEAQTIDANISIGYGLAIGDVDGDGKKDILLADKKQFTW